MGNVPHKMTAKLCMMEILIYDVIQVFVNSCVDRAVITQHVNIGNQNLFAQRKAIFV